MVDSPSVSSGKLALGLISSVSMNRSKVNRSPVPVRFPERRHDQDVFTEIDDCIDVAAFRPDDRRVSIDPSVTEPVWGDRDEVDPGPFQ